MLEKPSEQVAEALGRARAAEQRAGETGDPELKATFQDIARRYRVIAENFQFVESVDRFLGEGKITRAGLPPERPLSE